MPTTRVIYDSIAQFCTPERFKQGMLALESKNPEQNKVWSMWRLTPYSQPSIKDTWLTVERTPCVVDKDNRVQDDIEILSSGLAVFEKPLHGYEILINPDDSDATKAEWKQKFGIDVFRDMIVPVKSYGVTGPMNMLMLEFAMMTKIDKFGFLFAGTYNAPGDTITRVAFANEQKGDSQEEVIAVMMQSPITYTQDDIQDSRFIAAPKSFRDAVFHENRHGDKAISPTSVIAGGGFIERDGIRAYYVSYMNAWTLFNINTGELEKTVPDIFTDVAGGPVQPEGIKKGFL